MDEMLNSVYNGDSRYSIVTIEKYREQMELSLTENILMYNHKVDGQIQQLEKAVLTEILGLTNDTDKEQAERLEND